MHGGGVDTSAYNNHMEFITVGTLGNSVDIADLNFLSGYAAACDDIDECANVKFLDHIEFTAERGFDNRPEDEDEHAALHERENHTHH